MRNVRVLELLNKGKIDILKEMLRDEIYQESLKSKPNAKKRYTAMKKYFSYYNGGREVLQKPCKIDFDGEKYTSFTNSYSLVLTKENTGEIKLFDESTGKYPDVTRLISFEGNKQEVDFSKVLANAKSQGYKLKKSEVGFGYRYLLLYEGAYFKIGLLDATFRVIDDGEPATVYHKEGPRNKMTIVTSIGIAVIIPVFVDGDPKEEEVIVIDISEVD